jgi:hypothetical protein
MALSSPGLGSNLDVNSIISQLMSLEQRPLTALSQKEASLSGQDLGARFAAGNDFGAADGCREPGPGTGTTATQKFTVFANVSATRRSPRPARHRAP